MNIYIAVDMEGISGVYHPDQTSTGSRYEEARRFMTWDINACAEGCKKAGANKIIVADVHYKGDNVIWPELSSKIDSVVVGTKGLERRFTGIEECDAVILLGYHAMAGTAGGVLEHTWNSKGWQNLWINGQLAGEIALDTAIAGGYGKPVIMVSGDDYTCAEAKALKPDIITAEVKKGVTAFGARLLLKEAAHELISSCAERAVKQAGSINPYDVKKPITLRVELVERQQLPSQHAKPYMKIIDGRTYEVTGDTVEEALFRL